MGFRFLFQVIFPTEGLKPRLQRWQGYSLPLKRLGSNVGAPWFTKKPTQGGSFPQDRAQGRQDANPRHCTLTTPALCRSAIKNAPGGTLRVNTDTSFTFRRLK